ncbi:MAG: type II secretion system protein N [Parvularculaceae bacterium]|nr:type II secretion system protein N [Parvularculaceae bacterium]
MTGVEVNSSDGARRTLFALSMLGFAIAIVAFAPASLGAWLLKRALPLTSVAGAEGTIWRGRLTGLAYNSVLLGDVEYKLRSLSLLSGRLELDTISSNGALAGEARLSVSSGAVEIKDAAAEFNLGAIRRYTFFGVPYQGLAMLKAKRLKLTRSGCEAKGASLSTTALEALSRRWSGGPLPMSGPVECRDGSMIVNLGGSGSDGRVSIEMTLRPDLTYAVRVAAEPNETDVGQALRFFGFEDNGKVLSYEAAGVLKGLSS